MKAGQIANPANMFAFRQAVSKRMKRLNAAKWPKERGRVASDGGNTLWEARRATIGHNPKPYIPLKMAKKRNWEKIRCS